MDGKERLVGASSAAAPWSSAQQRHLEMEVKSDEMGAEWTGKMQESKANGRTTALATPKTVCSRMRDLNTTESL